ncbi:transcription elongation factor Spt5 [Pseudovirgaria hyperparasitica]|uniref:Transcription elongation factor SPT5 n=1 Tax=Pseudovirgaria hyperparasitica TaxID=470096 RepID=A0A6A6VXI4_9PEZI|nr:transcription elongation factor Spt5 [Pseudovirgaria hyperparasitica]KAF2754404.1 transcription elongation factor Spt5 [Pseudovirgaria hyperparasitica]
MSTSNFLDQQFNDSDDEEDFNPSAHIDEDDVQPPATKDRRSRPPAEDEDEQGSRPTKRSRSRHQSGDEDNEDEAGGDEDEEGEGEDLGNDDDEDEEEDDEEDEVRGHTRKRRKRDARLQFIDVEAEVDEEDEEEMEDEEGDMPEEVHPDDLLDVRDDNRDDRRHRELDRQREMEASMDAEKQAAALRERYGRSRAAAIDSAVVPQRLLLPSVDDPSIWGVRCKPGKEKEVIFSITKRQQEQALTREPLQIFSAFERGAGTMAGYIYIEARTQNAVFTATEGIAFCYPRTKMILIPVNEMPDLLRVTKSKTLNPGAYVRMKRPAMYAGDLAQVVAVEANGVDVTVKLIPRLDYGLNEDVNAPATDKKRKFGKPANMPRPPQRLFNETEARKGRNAKFLSVNGGLGRRDYTYKGDSYENGFLIKDYRITYLETENVNPKLDEVSKFAAGAADGTEELDLTALANTLKNSVTADAFLPGDLVELSQGEQAGVVGRAISVRGEIVTLKVTEGMLVDQTIEAPIKALRKKFAEGDYVKVLAGKYQDEVGMVVKVKGDQVTFLADSNNQEMPVLSRDLRLASAATNLPSSGVYDLYDLVQLDVSTVACIVRVDRESLKVLDQNGSVRTMLPSQISSKIEKRARAVATDRDGSELRPDDTVKESGMESKQGRIMHIHRNFLFCQNRQQTENAGIFVTRSTNVTTVAAKGGRVQNAGPDLTKMNPALQPRNGAPNAGGAMAPPKTFGRDKLIGKTVHVKKGPHKGLLGIVKDTTDLEARVELHTKSKTITMKKDILAIKDPITGQSVDFNRFGNTRPKIGGGTPGRFGPNAAGPTPSWGGSRMGGATPAWKSGGAKTPAWSSAKTPAWQGGNDGGRTAYGGNDGSRTAYGGNDGSRTAYGGNDGSRTAYGNSTWSASAKTPNPYATDASSSTWGSSASRNAASPPSNTYQSAPTPAAYDAPTPGFAAPTPGDHATPRYGAGSYGNYATPAGAPTPGAYAAPTPGGYAETPGGFAETPGQWSAPTPAATGDDDPRYE